MTMTPINPFAQPAEVKEHAGRIKMSRGQYMLPDPDTGKVRGFTRVSTIAKMLDDTYHLDLWKDRTLAVGMARRPDLAKLARGMDPNNKDHKWELKKLVEQARDSATGSDGSNHGTAFHTLTEGADRGDPVPPGTEPDMAAQLELYTIAMFLLDARPYADWTERVVLNRDYDLVGRLDRMMSADPVGLGLPPGPRINVIGDVKSQKTMDFGQQAIAMQESIYGNAHLWWNDVEGRWEDIDPDLISKQWAVVMHTPSIDVRADMWRMDIEQGYRDVQLAMDVRNSRKNKAIGTMVLSVDNARWYGAIVRAQNEAELVEIGRAAMREGAWTADLKAAGKRRMTQLNTGRTD